MIQLALTHYDILGRLGSGGSGGVFLARDLRLGRKVALKLLHCPEPRQVRLKRFEREARSLAALNHPGIVTIYSIEEDEGRRFITMEWLRGRRLGDVIPRAGLDLGTFYDLALSMAAALRATHRAGIVHRDLKPDNVMVQGRGTKILDFGLAKLTESNEHLTETGKLVGTVPYMAPEQLLDGEVTPATDVFNLGLLFHEMLTGSLPFGVPASQEGTRKSGKNWGTTLAILENEPVPVTAVRDGVPEELGKLVLQCLEKDPQRRPSTSEITVRLAELGDEHRAAESWIVRLWRRVCFVCPRVRRQASHLVNAW